MLMRLATAFLLAALSTPAIPAHAQTPDSRRAQASRAELEAHLGEIDQILSSAGYSGRLRASKRSEAELLRQRLREGDFQVGDHIVLSIAEDTLRSRTYTVGTGRTLAMPGMPEIPLTGVLRSELQTFLIEHLKRYIRDPEVRAQSLIRLSFFGAVGQPGFHHVPAEFLAGDAIMAAGGPSTVADPNKTVVRRAGVEIWGKDAFQDALVQGLTLDQLNLRAGDEFFIGTTSRRDPFLLIGALSAVGTIAVLMERLF
jgi:protein involved in polysaccharide export with SLBB domain